MSRHDTSPHETDGTAPAIEPDATGPDATRPNADDTGPDAGEPDADGPDDTESDADESGPRPARRRLLVWFAVPVVIAFGAGGGYLAAEAWAPAAKPPAATAVDHSGHEESETETHDGTHGADEHGADEHGADEHGTDEPVVANGSRTVVLVGFAAVNAAILFAAAMLRRHRPRPARRPAAARTA